MTLKPRPFLTYMVAYESDNPRSDRKSYTIGDCFKIQTVSIVLQSAFRTKIFGTNHVRDVHVQEHSKLALHSPTHGETSPS